MSRQVHKSLDDTLAGCCTDLLISMGPLRRCFLHMLILLNALNKDPNRRIILSVCIAEHL